MKSKNIVILGAGKIGRGFVADLFTNSGFTAHFIDSDKEVIRKLNELKVYTVQKIAGLHEHAVSTINAFTAHETQDPFTSTILSENSLIAIALFPQAFKSAAELLAKSIEKRVEEKNSAFVNVLLCANTSHPAEQFEKILETLLSDEGKRFLHSNVGLIDTLVMRIAVEPSKEQIEQDPLVVVTNGYPEMPVDKTAFKGELPELKGVVWTESMDAEEARKLYTYNMLHAFYSYLGKAKGYTTILEAVNDIEITEQAMGALDESSRALSRAFDYTTEQMEQWNTRVIKNISNPLLKDTIDRLGGDPLRKLQRTDRLVGPTILARQHGIMPYYLSKAIAYALLYVNVADVSAPKVSEFTKVYGVRESLKKFSKLEREPDVMSLVADHYQKALIGNGIKEDVKRVAVLKKAWESGFYYEKKNKGCAQCTLLGLFDTTGKKEPLLFQATSGLSGGIAICGEGSCGGYTGGVLYMGSYVGRRLDKLDEGDKEAQYKSYEMSQDLHDKYIETYNAVNCADIHKDIFGKSFSLRTKAIRDEFEDAGGHVDKCTNVIAAATAWVADILYKNGYLEV